MRHLSHSLENIVRRSYPYVAMYNVKKFARGQGGWNTADADTELKDHTMQDIARPNNDRKDEDLSVIMRLYAPDRERASRTGRHRRRRRSSKPKSEIWTAGRPMGGQIGDGEALSASGDGGPSGGDKEVNYPKLDLLVQGRGAIV